MRHRLSASKEVIDLSEPTDRKTTGYGENKILSICKWEEGNITLEVRENLLLSNGWKTTQKIVLYEKAQEILKQMMGG